MEETAASYSGWAPRETAVAGVRTAHLGWASGHGWRSAGQRRGPGSAVIRNVGVLPAPSSPWPRLLAGVHSGRTGCKMPGPGLQLPPAFRVPGLLG